MSRPTLRDVATAAGVSVTQASTALNGTGRVAPQTVARVREAADELGYRPDAFARGLRKGSGNALGLVVRNLSNSYFLDVVRGMDDVCSEADCSLLIMDSDYDYAREHQAVQRMVNYRVLGLAIAPIGGSHAVDWWREHSSGRPVVLINTEPSPGLVCVGPDGPMAVRQALEEFHVNGHRRVAFVGAPSKMQADVDRRAAFFEAASAFGMEGVSLETSLSFDGTYATILRELERPDGCRAFLMNSDYTASAVYAATAETRLRIGRDVSVVGHDGIPTSALFDPPLTTILFDRREVGRRVARAMLALAAGEQVESVLLPTTLKRGGSVAGQTRG